MTETPADPSTWYEATRTDRTERARLNFDLDVDVCVVGGGLAGLTAAREVARRGWSVALIESGRIGGGASGRSNGFVLPGFSEDMDTVVERIGLDHAKQLWALSQGGVDYIRAAIRDLKMPDVEAGEGWLKVAKTDNAGAVRAKVERLRWIGAEVEFWDMARVRQALSSAHYFSAMSFPGAFHINPLNYALGLARAAEELGVRIFEDTPAIELDPAGVRKRIRTPSGTVRAAHVVLAANVQLGNLMPRLSATLVPVTTHVIVTEPLGPLFDDVISYRGAVSDGNRGANHFRALEGGRLLWSSRITTKPVNPRRFARSLAASVRAIFPQFEKVEIAHLWSGTFGRAVHRMPQIGEISRGLWVASAFGGHGLNTTAMAGELIARAIVENDQTWRLFAPYELVWAGGQFGRRLVQAVHASARPAILAAESFSRYRERARVRAEARAAQVQASGPPGPAALNPPADPPESGDRRKGGRRKKQPAKAE